MPVRRDPLDDAGRRARYQLERAVDEIRLRRIGAGVSQRRLAQVLKCSRQLIGAMEAGQLQDIGAVQLARMAAAVGLDMPIRTYASGSALRDAAQLRLLGRFRATIGEAWTWHTEVPVSSRTDDRRTIDAVLVRASRRVGIEALTRLTDAQDQVRSFLLKQQAAGLEYMVLVLADTRHNRRALNDASPTLLPAFPCASRSALRDLRAGRVPATNGVVLV